MLLFKMYSCFRFQLCVGYLLMLAVVDVPLEAESIKQVLKLEIICLVEVGQEAMEELAAAHPRGWFDRSGKIDVNNLRHHLLVVNRRAQFFVLPSF